MTRDNTAYIFNYTVAPWTPANTYSRSNIHTIQTQQRYFMDVSCRFYIFYFYVNEVHWSRCMYFYYCVLKKLSYWPHQCVSTSLCSLNHLCSSLNRWSSYEVPKPKSSPAMETCSPQPSTVNVCDRVEETDTDIYVFSKYYEIKWSNATYQC